MSHIRRPRPAKPRLSEEAARLQEERDEALAPAIQRLAVVDAEGVVLREARVKRTAWRDPDDDDPNRRTPREVIAFRTVDVVEELYLMGVLAAEAMSAGRRLSEDYEIGDGARPGYVRPDVRSEGALLRGPSDDQLDALGRYRAAVQALGQIHCAVLLPVVLSNQRPVLGAYGALLAAFEVLVGYYDQAR